MYLYSHRYMESKSDNIKFEVVDDTNFKFKNAGPVPQYSGGQQPTQPQQPPFKYQPVDFSKLSSSPNSSIPIKYDNPSYQPPPSPTYQPTNMPTQPPAQPTTMPQQQQTPPTYKPPTYQPTNMSQQSPSFGASTPEMNKNVVNFDIKMREYVAKYNPRIYILTPCYGSMCHLNYVSCLIQTMNVLKQYGIDVMVEFCKNDSLVSRARNNLVAKAMNDPKMTHIMFIDSDISWEPISIMKLLVDDKHIVGGVYPLKHYSWERLLTDPQNPYKTNILQSWIQSKDASQLKMLVTNEDLIKHKLLTYNINYLDNFLKIDENLAKVRHTATGFMMIKRTTVENMMKGFPHTKYTDDVKFLKPEENRFAYALFDCGVEDDHYYSEDWLFCHRWQKMGGDIYIDVSINLTHSGMEDYCGSFIASIVN